MFRHHSGQGRTCPNGDGAAAGALPRGHTCGMDGRVQSKELHQDEGPGGAGDGDGDDEGEAGDRAARAGEVETAGDPMLARVVVVGGRPVDAAAKARMVDEGLDQPGPERSLERLRLRGRSSYSGIGAPETVAEENSGIAGNVWLVTSFAATEQMPVRAAGVPVAVGDRIIVWLRLGVEIYPTLHWRPGCDWAVPETLNLHREKECRRHKFQTLRYPFVEPFLDTTFLVLGS